jgi:hypothetical protein
VLRRHARTPTGRLTVRKRAATAHSRWRKAERISGVAISAAAKKMIS